MAMIGNGDLLAIYNGKYRDYPEYVSDVVWLARTTYMSEPRVDTDGL